MVREPRMSGVSNVPRNALTSQLDKSLAASMPSRHEPGRWPTRAPKNPTSPSAVRVRQHISQNPEHGLTNERSFSKLMRYGAPLYGEMVVGGSRSAPRHFRRLRD